MMKKLLTLLICLCMAVLPAMAAGAYDRTADAGTIDTWKTFFGEEVTNTHNAGAVWTDKSVYTADSAANQLPQEWGSFRNSLITDTGDNFLVALSAMSSNKAIDGRETIPTDTIFVLDVSSSMYGGSNRQAETVEAMVNAVNSAMSTLQMLNVANRVGVVLYLGGDTVYNQSTSNHGLKLLPLSRYTPDGNILTVKRSGNKLSDIVITSGVKDQYTSSAPAGVGDWVIQDIAGTFAQRGIQIASDMFSAASTVVTEAEDPYQEGKHRIPIMILMTDGLPTAATSNFSNVQNAQWGNNANGERSDAESDFVTQLTAALAREKMARHYDQREPLFFTLGLGTDGTLAKDILDPKGQDLLYNSVSSYSYSVYTNRASASGNYANTAAAVNRQIAQYWNSLVNSGSVSFRALVCDSSYDWDRTQSFSVSRVSNITGTVGSDGSTYTIGRFPTSIDQKYYVDHAFTARQASDLNNAFANIVEIIRIQSEYYPTAVLKDPATDGYITFVDDIGEHMNVRSVKGLVSGNVLYTGQTFAQTVLEGLKGNVNYEAAYQEIIAALAVRMSLDNTQDVEYLLRAAVEAGDIHIAGNGFNNKIVWYATYDAAKHTVHYMPYEDMRQGLAAGSAQERVKENYAYYAPDKNVIPQGARYRITSYSFGGSNQNRYQAQQWLYGFLRVAEEIDASGKLTGRQFVDWRIPAALIPLVKYKVMLENSDPDNPGQISLVREPAVPIHVLYEVELDPEITVYNVADKVSESGKNYDPQSESYVFYTNDWEWASDGSTSLDRFDYESPGQVKNTVAWFTPNTANERYYTPKNADLYVRSQNGEYVRYAGNTHPKESSEIFYVQHDVYSVDSWSAGASRAQVRQEYDRCVYRLDQAKKDNSGWYIPAGTVHPMIADGDDLLKEPNKTNTLPYVNYAAIKRPEGNGHNHDYFAIATLGNNGLLRLKPPTASAVISGVKRVNGDQPGMRTFAFELYRANAEFARQGSAIKTVESAKETGVFSFGELTYDRLGTYYYVVAEKAGSAAHMDYDPAEYRITVIIGENAAKDGMTVTMSIVRYDDGTATPVDQIIFQNAYQPPMIPDQIEILVKKRFNGAVPSGANVGRFRFLLSDYETGEVIRTAVNGMNGEAVFDRIVFEDEGIYCYVISEEIPEKRDGILYDDSRYLVTVSVSSRVVDYQQILSVDSITYQKIDEENQPIGNVFTEAPVFSNVTMPSIPKTGDSSRLMLFALLLVMSVAGLVVLRCRKRTD